MSKMRERHTFIICLILFVSHITSIKTEDIDDDVTIETVDDSQSDVPYDSPEVPSPEKVYFADHFDDPSKFRTQWIKSQAKKDNIEDEIAKYDGLWEVEPAQKDSLPGDLGLVLKSKAKHAAISAPLSRPFKFENKPLIVQYEVLFQDGQECGGAYLKLISDHPDAKDLTKFHDKTSYSIMFGPDKCGNDHKLHFIFKHKNPLNGSVEEKHCQKPKERLEEYFSDKLPHLYTLILKPDNTFEVRVDNNVINSGSLLEDFVPPVNPPEEIEDPDDKKPENWDEREKIPDPSATKPDDWDEDAPAQIVDETARMPDGWLVDESTHIPDPKGEKPGDWDTEMDGEWEPPLIENPKCADAPGCGKWEPPLINNPAYKGKWRPPLINNPNYRGKWRPKKIRNPNYFEDKQPFKMNTVYAVGFELWSMSKDILFDNIIITEELEIAEKWAAETFDKKRQKIAKDSATFWGRMLKKMNYKPKTWALCFVYCSIPVILYGYYLYKCVTEEKEEKRLEAEKKKTDQVNEDVIEEEDEEQEANRNETKDDEDAEKISNPDSDEDNEAVEEETAPEEQSGGATRKRKVRKD
ncbi:unnamed protein product [Acanthoscelides obtectus]|uniref:Calnexin n=1 Tax=Acanthoscelides obtectus TaxID=200917 RepID=A0A9P0PXB5_ACAOB|nr:unnamed protein product [Acanthoscelides obtectus]CAK1638695.1 Calnexin [Acanthoscelides obtectus]